MNAVFLNLALLQRRRAVHFNEQQIAYLLGISLETDQIRVVKIFLYVIAAGLVQTGSIEAVSIKRCWFSKACR